MPTIRWPYREDNLFSFLSLVVLILPLVFVLLTYETFETAKLTCFMLFVGGALLVFFRRLRAGLNVWQLDKASLWIIGALGLLAIASTLFSQDRLFSLFGVYYRLTSSLLFYGLWAAFFLLLQFSLTRDRLEFLLKLVCFGAMINGLMSFLQSLRITYYVSGAPDVFLRPPGLLGNPDFTAMFLAVSFPLAFYFLWQGKHRWSKIYFALVLLFIVLGSVVTTSRGSILALVVGLVFLLAGLVWWKAPKRMLLVYLTVCFLALLLGREFLQLSRPDFIAPIVRGTDVNGNTRLLAWQIIAQGITQHPWLGTGPGTLTIFFQGHRPSSLAQQVGIFDDAHNLFLHLAETTGVPFAILFFAWVGFLCWRGLKAGREENDWLSLILVISVLVWLGAAMFNPVTISIYMILAVLLAGLSLPYLRQVNFQISWPWQILPVVAGSVLLVAGFSFILAEYLFAFSLQAYHGGDYERALKLGRLAVKFNPTNSQFIINVAASEINLSASPNVIMAEIGRMVDQHPRLALTHINAANLYDLWYVKTGQTSYLDEAIASAQQALRLEPDFSSTYSLLGSFYFVQGNLQAAKAQLIYAVNSNPNNLVAWVMLARIYQSENLRSPLIMALEQAHRIEPDIPQLKLVLQLARQAPHIQDVPLALLFNKPDPTR